VTDRPVTVRGATVLGNLERLHAFSAQPNVPPPQEAPADAEKRIVDEMMAKVDETVPDEFKAKLRQLLMRYSSVFSRDELDLGFTDLVTHRIDTGYARPVRQQLRRYPPAHLDVIDQHLHDMQRQGIIEPCSSPWASNMVWQRNMMELCAAALTTNSSTVAPSVMPTLCRVRTCVWMPLPGHADLLVVIFIRPSIKSNWIQALPTRQRSSPEEECSDIGLCRLD